MVHVTLPSGDEELTLNHPVSFINRRAYSEFLEQTQGLDENEKNDFLEQQVVPSKNLGLFEAELSDIVKVVRKQCLPIENSFVSYYS